MNSPHEARVMQAIRVWIIEQRRVPEHIPAAVREERDERERFEQLMKTIGGTTDGKADD